MQPKKIKYYLLALFIAGMILFIVLQFNSAHNIQKLISGNEQLLQQLNVKNELLKLQTNMAKTDSKVRGTVISQDTLQITGIEAEIAIIKADLFAINKMARTDSTEKLLNQLGYLVEEKNNFNVQVLDTFYNKGKWAAEKFINNEKGKRLTEAITGILHQLDTTRQTEVNRATHIIDTSGQSALRWGTVLVFFACLSSLLAFLYIISRIHKQEQLIDALDESQTKERTLAGIKEQFLANMSHEIRTPMNAVLGFTHLLKVQPLNQKSNEYVTAIENAGENLLDIINDILDISKIESGMMRIEATSFSIRGLLHSLHTMFKPKAQEKQLELTIKAAEQVPDILFGDATRLTQVLVNLINNAIKFTNSGAVSILVSKSWQHGNAVRLLFTITDTGIGIAADKLPTIFDRFNQAETDTTRKYGGTGLGLTIVKQLVELQNGFIAVESRPEKGTTFKVELPYTISDLLPENGDTFSPEGKLLPFYADVHLLVAEDNRLNQQLLQHLLESWQLHYQLVNNGKDALSALSKRHFDLVLMDIQMPEMDGYTTAQKIRTELASNVPIIAMTAHVMKGEREKCLQYGMNEYIAKPIREEDLYRMIQVFTGNNSMPEFSVYSPAFTDPPAQLINLQYLQQLSKGNKAFERTMLEQFITQLPEDLAALKNAILEDNIPGIQRTAHNIKTTVAFIGLESLLYPVLEQFENADPAGYNASETNNQFNLLKQQCLQAIQEAMNILL